MGSLGSCRDVPVSAGVAAASTYAISKRNRLIRRTDNVTNFVRTKLRNTAVKVNGRLPFKLCHRLKPTQRKARTTDMNTQALRIPFDPYDGYTPYPECQFDPIYAGPSVSHHIGFHIPDNRYVLEIPERLDTDALYSDHWQRFLDWAGDRGLSALPASPVVVAVYLTTLAETTNVLDALTAAEAIYSVHRWAAIPSPFDAPILQLTTKRILWGYPPRSPYAPPTIDLNRDTIC